MAKTITRTPASEPLVETVILFCSDTDAGITRAQFRSNVDAAILAIRQVFWDILGVGRTFNAAPAVLYEDARTEAQMITAYGASILTSSWQRTLMSAHLAGQVDLTSPFRLPVFVTPCTFSGDFIGGHTSSLVFNGFGLIPRVGHASPGTVFAGAGYYGRWIGNVGSSGSQADGRWVFGHELGHAFGSSEYVAGLGPGQQQSLPHSAASTSGDPAVAFDTSPASARLMAGVGTPSGVTGGTWPAVVLSQMEKHRMLRSPFLIAQSRPA